MKLESDNDIDEPGQQGSKEEEEPWRAADSKLLAALQAGVDPSREALEGYKIVLYQNEVYGRRDFLIGEGLRPFSWDHCSHHRCYATTGRHLPPDRQPDAVLFHVGSDEHWLPRRISWDTIYIAFNLESPHYRYGDVDFREYNGFFNWTMTYRSDSDLWGPYGSFVLRETPLPPSTKNFAAGKTKMAAWLVSHCDTRSEREIVGKILRQHMAVDVYGDCGPHKCSRENLTRCNLMVERDYKFYFSFENSVCKDYVTEKVFRMMRYDVVPVLYGKGPDPKLVPRNAYINLLDFESLEDAADYLKYLDSNDTAYNEYFKYRETHEFRPMFLDHRANFCEICKRLHTMYPIAPDGSVSRAPITPETRHWYRSYPDFYDWWDRKSQCFLPRKNAQFYHWIRGMSKTEIRAAGLRSEVGIEGIAERPNFPWPGRTTRKTTPHAPPPAFRPVIRRKPVKKKA